MAAQLLAKGTVTMRLANILLHFHNEEAGASMVEYGVAVLVVAAIGAGAMTTLGGTASTSITSACAVLGAAC